MMVFLVLSHAVRYWGRIICYQKFGGTTFDLFHRQIQMYVPISGTYDTIYKAITDRQRVHNGPCYFWRLACRKQQQLEHGARK